MSACQKSSVRPTVLAGHSAFVSRVARAEGQGQGAEAHRPNGLGVK